MDETQVSDVPTAGERLRAAREDKGFSLEDIAAETRIPRRHLESVEAGDWERLPAPTYTIGFAKSYASAVGLDRAEIGEQLRLEMGGYRNDTATVEHFEPADPARAMPKWLVLSAIAAIVLAVAFFSWMRSRSLSDEAPAPSVAGQPAEQAGPPPASQPAQPEVSAQGPVVLTAIGPAWIQVKDGGKILFEGILQQGQTYQIPADAAAPVLRAGAPEALRITVGNAVAPPVGPGGAVASNISLRPADLLGGAAGAAPRPQVQAAPNPLGNRAGQ